MKTSAIDARKALADANRVRVAKQKAKRDIAAGLITVADAVGLDCCQNATLYELLCAQRLWGDTRACDFLADAVRASAIRRVRELSRRQLDVVAAELGKATAA